MAIGDYRFRVPGGAANEPSVALNGFVNFNVFVEVQVDDDPEAWSQIPMGHLTIPVSGELLEKCGTAAEAKNLLADIIVNKGIAQAHRARAAMIALLPGGTWPESDITQVLEME